MRTRSSAGILRLLIRGPGIRVPSSAPKSHEESQDSSWDFLFILKLHGFCTVRIFRVRWSKSVNYSAIRAIFCNSGQQSQAKLRFYRGVCVLQKLQQCRHGDGRFCFNRGSLHRCCSLYGFHITAGDHQLVSRAQAARWNRWIAQRHVGVQMWRKNGKADKIHFTVL